MKNKKMLFSALTMVSFVMPVTMFAQNADGAAQAVSVESVCSNASECTKCNIMQMLRYQLNAVRNDIVLPSEIDGKRIRWEMSNASGGDNEYMTFDGKTLHVKKLPKGDYMKIGILKAEVDGEAMKFNVTLAPDDGMFGYLYCHMAGTSENTLYALGTKEDGGVKFHPLLDNQPVYDAEEIAGIEGGVRDAFILRAAGGNGYLMVTTDMSNRKSRTWFNHGINLLKSNDLIHWTSTTFDFRKGSEIFSDPDSRDVYKDYSLINRVWAPQMIWDKDYDNGKGGYFVYYSMLSTNEGDDHDRMYYSYADKDFTTLTKPRLFHDRGIAMIDCHIEWNDCDRQYHVFFKREGVSGYERGIYKAVFDKLGSGQWRDVLHITNEGKENVEGPSAFRLINENRWKVAYIRYSGGKCYKLCNADALLENIDKGTPIEGDVNPQHGSFMTVTEEEYNLLETWSALKLRIQELETSSPKAAASKKVKAAKAALEVVYDDNPIAQLTALYAKHLNALK